MQKTSVVVWLCALFAATAVTQEIPVINGEGASLKDLVGSEKLVTVVLKDSEATDPNLRIVDIGPDYFAVLSRDDERSAYLFASVKEIRVQEGPVEVKKLSFTRGRSLRAEEQRVLSRAYQRATEIFGAANADQDIKMRAAALLVVKNDSKAHEYLRRLAASDDLETEVDATVQLFLAGDEDIDGSVVAMGLQSGNPKVRARAAALAGLLQDRSVENLLLDMVRDRSADLSAPAARALAQLGKREAIPALMRMIGELNEDKGKAAVYALTTLGGDDVIDQLKAKLEVVTEQSKVRYRLALVLYNLGDPEGKKLFAREMMDSPTLAPEAALILARDGNYDAMQLLMTRLKRPYDEKYDVMSYRAEAAAALIEGGDPTAISYLQKLLRTDNKAIKKAVCRQIFELGKRNMMTVTQPAIEHSDHNVAAQACLAAVALAVPEFRDRLLLYYY